MIKSYYLDTLLSAHARSKGVAEAIRSLKGVEFDCFICTGSSGLIFGSAVATAMDKDIVLVRKATIDCHSIHLVEGETTHRVGIFIDDCVSSGGTLRRVRDTLRDDTDFKNLRITSVYLKSGGLMGKGTVDRWLGRYE